MDFNIYKKTGLFYALSTFIPWGFWSIAGYISHIDTGTATQQVWASIIAFLGLLSPLIVTLFLSRGNSILIHDLRSRIFNFKGVKATYIVLAFVLMPFSILMAQAVSVLFGYSLEQFLLAETFSFSSGVFPVWVMLFIAPLLEELAWHSYGTDCLRSRYNLITTSLLFASFWAAWHMPLAGIKDYYHSNLVEESWIYSLNFIVSLFPFVIIMNWIYYKAKRNIILPAVFHIAAVFFNELFATHPMSKVFQTGLLVIFAVYIILNDKDFFFLKETKEKATRVSRRFKPGFGFAILGVFLFATTNSLSAQEITQTINGKIFDELTNESLPFATVVVVDSDPIIGTLTDIDGNFSLQNVKVGRISIKVSMVGYDSFEVNELLINSGKELNLNIGLRQRTTGLKEVVVRVRKETALNSMTTLSSRQFTVEETQRYAGGMDDPARLASSFAGVATPSISNNGISVRGNNPDGLLWRIDGVEVPAPMHFGNLTISGGGLLTAISNEMMANSDFYTGAFPAEYGNASSGVFDINLKTGNTHNKQYSFAAGLLGVGASAEGPFTNNGKSSYIINYRNSTMAILEPILPDGAGILKYQDLAFKTSFPNKKSGTFTFWGIGTLDAQDMDVADSTDWKSNSDRDNSETSLYLFATALTHKKSINSNTFINSSLSASGNGLKHKEQRVDYNLEDHPQSKTANNTYQISFQTNITKQFNKNHTNKTGLRYSYLVYNVDVKQALEDGAPLTSFSNQKGSSGFLQTYSQSKISLVPQLCLNIGVNAQYFFLNNNYSIEPRVGVKYDLNSKHSLAFAYGLHSRLEQMPIYFVSKDGDLPNKNLDFMTSAHYIISYNTKLTDNLRLSIEPYYQKLNDVPVSPNSYASTLNNNNTIYYDDVLVDGGKGHNIGVDITIEKFLTKGYYYMVTASAFDSKYTALDGIERNTRFNKNYVFNIMGGKEWKLTNNRIFCANVRVNYLGGNRKEAIDVESSLLQKDIVYAETGTEYAFSKQSCDIPVVSLTIIYRKNKQKYSSVWSLQFLNANGAQEYTDDFYNIKTHKLDEKLEGIIIPNISYKIEF